MFETLQRLLDASESPDFADVVFLHKNILITAYQKVSNVRRILNRDINLDDRFWKAADILAIHGIEMPRFNRTANNESLHKRLMHQVFCEDNEFSEYQLVDEFPENQAG